MSNEENPTGSIDPGSQGSFAGPESAAAPTAPAEETTPPAAAPAPAQTVETQTVEQASEAYTGQTQTGGPQTADAAPVAPENGPTTPAENAPAFAPPPAPEQSAPIVAVTVPADPDGSIMVGLVRESLRNRLPMVRSKAIFELLNTVAADDTTVRALSIVERRIVEHVGTGTVTVASLEDVLQGDEARKFAERSLPAPQLLAFFQEVTPEVVRLLQSRPTA